MLDKEELQDKANIIREIVIKMLVEAGSGHSGGPLGSADFWTTLYFGDVINFRADQPNWNERDRVVVSAGHYAPVVYATLAEVGFFDKKELFNLRKLDSRLQGHPHRLSFGGQMADDGRGLPGIENSSGPLGQGISQAVGMALAARLDNKKYRVICFMSDGEQNEGQVWEAYMLAAKNKLFNLTIVIDRNNIQIDGNTENIMPLEPLVQKLTAFGLHVIEIDGHNIGEIVDALNRARAIFEKPTVILMHTIPGKGVAFMENDYTWHGKLPNKLGEAVEALSDIHQIRTLGGRIISEHE